MVRRLLGSCVVVLCLASAAAAQPPAAVPAPAAPPAAACGLQQLLSNSKQWVWEQITVDHWKLTGDVKLDLCQGVAIFAEQVDVFQATNQLVASGNVVFNNPEGRIVAEKVEFSIATATGTFHQA